MQTETRLTERRPLSLFAQVRAGFACTKHLFLLTLFPAWSNFQNLEGNAFASTASAG